MKTLFSMTDFVLSEIKEPYTDSERLRVITNYANFLKQPLKLEMFVPCVNGEPFNYSLHGNKKEYEQAKEKVLFEGFEVDKDGDIVHKDKKLIVNTETCRINQTVESYVSKNLTLTPTALKQIGL